MNYRRLISAALLSTSLILIALIPANLVSAPAGGSSAAPQLAAVDVARQSLAALQNDTRTKISAAVSRETGAYNFVNAEGAGVLAADNPLATPEERARVFLSTRGGLVGMSAAERDLVANPSAATSGADASALQVAKVATDHIGATHVKFNQTFKGLKVFGAQLIVHMNDHGITAVNGSFIPGIAIDTYPAVNAGAAAKQALAVVSKSKAGSGAKLSVVDTELAIYRTGLFEGYAGANVLAHGIKIADESGPLEQVWISAQTGAELNRIPLRHEALYRRVYAPRYDSSNPDLFVVRDENGPPNVGPIEGLFQFSGQTYNLFASAFGRDSFDGLGTIMRTVYLVNSICPNAYWDGATTNYCPEIDGDDVVAHEWGHAYTQFTHDLVYSFQAGALNESYSDIWGETVDLLNNVDGDGGSNNAETYPKGQRWLIGEDVAGLGPLRDMWDPPHKDNPDKVSSEVYQCTPDDGGGVHTNSGVPNHAYAMIVDGKTFNGQTVTGIGFTKAVHIYFRAMTVYQHSSTNFPQHARSLMAACNDLATAGTNLNAFSLTAAAGAPSGEVITTADCQQVANAIAAVEMERPPTQCNFGPLLDPNTPADCPGAADVFAEDWESGDDGWTRASAGSNPGWPDFNFEIRSDLPAERAGHAAYAFGEGGGVCGDPNYDYSGAFSITSPEITAGPNDTNLQMSFEHFVATEFLVDGGNVLISVNGGSFALIPQENYTFNAPPSQLLDGPPLDVNTNPKAGQYAWSGADPEVPAFGTTKADLSSLVKPGDKFQLRFEFGLDGCGGNQGWYVDNIRVFNCPVLAAQVLSTGAGYENPDTNGSYELTWQRPEGASGPDTLQEATVCGPLYTDDADEPLVAGENSKWAGSPQWTTQVNPNSGSTAYYIANGSSQDEPLTMNGQVAVPAGARTTLSFRTTQGLESTYDYGHVEVSVDGGTTFTELAAYTGPEGVAPNTFFNGIRSIDLTPYAGQNVKLRFRVTSDTYNEGAPIGWYVEDIAIESENWADLALVNGTSRTVTNDAGSYCYRVSTAYTFGTNIGRSPFSNVIKVDVASGVFAPARLQNIAARARVQTDDNVLIGGFIIRDAAKRVIVRAIGPSLQSGGTAVQGRMTDPILELHQEGNPVPIGTNDDWQTNQAEVQATNLAPTDARESAIVATLNPGSYTAIMYGKGGEIGIGLVEIYALDATTSDAALRNLSARAFVESDDNVLIGGFIAGPAESGLARVVVRAIGPSLKDQLPNALDDTTLEVVDANGNPTTNDDWEQSPHAAQIQQAGLQPSHPLESAVMLPALAAGPHTAVVRGKGNPRGVGVVEIYNLQ